MIVKRGSDRRSPRRNPGPNYKLSCGLGKIEINDNNYSNISGSRKIQNEGAVGTIELDCGMGGIDVEFE